MAERESAFTSASFELVLHCKPFVINDSFPNFADLSGELKHDANGTFWHSHAVETVRTKWHLCFSTGIKASCTSIASPDPGCPASGIQPLSRQPARKTTAASAPVSTTVSRHPVSLRCRRIIYHRMPAKSNSLPKKSLFFPFQPDLPPLQPVKTADMMDFSRWGMDKYPLHTDVGIRTFEVKCPCPVRQIQQPVPAVCKFLPLPRRFSPQLRFGFEGRRQHGA